MNKHKKLNIKKAFRKNRTRSKIKDKNLKPRLSVFKSNKYVYAQIIDDSVGKTIASASSREIKEKMKREDSAKEIGRLVAEKALKAGVKNVVFDRGSYRYHGIIKSLSQGAREAGFV